MKFKVWNKDKKIFDERGYFYINQNGYLNRHGNKYEDVPECKPVFSTGQTDKNGIEIYEGDIVPTITQRNVEIVYSELDYLGFATKYDENCIVLITKTFLNKSVVIGNKFENPELLETKC